MEEVVRFNRFQSENQTVSSQGYRQTEKDQLYWVNLWIKKFYLAAKEQNVPYDKRLQMRGLIELFLWRNPGSPYLIDLAIVQKFSHDFREIGADSLRFFYSFTAISKQHVAVLGDLGVAKNEITKTPEEKKSTPILPMKPSSVSSEINRSNIAPVQYESKVTQVPLKAEVGEKKNAVQSKKEKKVRQQSHLQVAMNNSERAELLDKLKSYITVRNYSCNTLDNYMSAVARFLNRLTPDSSRDWSETFKKHLIYLKEQEQLAPNTINQHAASIAYFLEEVLDLSPGDDICIRMKTGHPLPRVHSTQNIARIIMCPTNQKHRLILTLTYGCGLRLGEVVALKAEDIDIERGVLWVRGGKGKKDRMVMLDNTLKPHVTEWLRSDDCGKTFLFEGYIDNKALSKRTVEKIYTTSCKKLNINNQGGLHSLRHSFATHLLEQGVNLRYIQTLLGHASSKTTEIYTHVAAHNIAGIRSPIAGLLGESGR